jgi:AcrR family transcriptional regulator
VLVKERRFFVKTPTRVKAKFSWKEREEEILTYAAKIFAEKGYDRATLHQIAEAVGMKKGSLYYYISSKEDLLFQITNSMIDYWIKELEKVTQADISPQEKLKQAIKTHVNLLAGDFERLCVFLHEYKSLTPAWREKIIIKRNEYEDLFYQIVKEGIETGVFQPYDAKVITLAILGMGNWLYQWYSPAGRLSIDEIAQIFSDLIMKGLEK